MEYRSNAATPFWRPAVSLLKDHRDLIRSMVRRDLGNRYKGSIMGVAWAIITPAVMIVLFTVIFSGIFKARFGAQGGHFDFAVYLFCGILPWIAFSDGVQRSAMAMTENANLVKRVVFPIEALPVNIALSAVATQLIGTIVLLAVALLIQRRLHLTVVFLPVLLIPQLMATIGLGWLMASLGVFIRDVPQFNQLFFSTWMYLTPIFYPETQVPSSYRWLVDLNPASPLIRSYRRILLEGSAPDWKGLALTACFAMLAFLVGYWWFERTRKAFADVL